MPVYIVECEVTATGVQIYEVEAESEEAAMSKVNRGEGEFIDEDLTPDTCEAVSAELKDNSDER